MRHAEPGEMWRYHKLQEWLTRPYRRQTKMAFAGQQPCLRRKQELHKKWQHYSHACDAPLLDQNKEIQEIQGVDSITRLNIDPRIQSARYLRTQYDWPGLVAPV